MARVETLHQNISDTATLGVILGMTGPSPVQEPREELVIQETIVESKISERPLQDHGQIINTNGNEAEIKLKSSIMVTINTTGHLLPPR